MPIQLGGTNGVAEIDATVAVLAASQGGVFSITQARRLGASESMIRRRRDRGRWRSVAPGVLAIAGAPLSEEQRRWTVVLSLGDLAVLSHEWAGRIHRLPALPLDVWSVMLPPSDHRRRKGFVVHQQQLAEVDRVRVDGFPVTSVPRTICDLAGTVSRARLRAIVEAAHFDLRWSFDALGAALGRVGTLGQRGPRQLGSLLDEYGPGEAMAASTLEAMLSEVLTRAGLPLGIAQHPLPGVGGLDGLVDRAFPEAKLIVEADGRRWHARTKAIVRDHERDLQASRAGWHTIRLVHEQLTADPGDVADSLVETYRRRLVRAA